MNRKIDSEVLKIDSEVLKIDKVKLKEFCSRQLQHCSIEISLVHELEIFVHYCRKLAIKYPLIKFKLKDHSHVILALLNGSK